MKLIIFTDYFRGDYYNMLAFCFNDKFVAKDGFKYQTLNIDENSENYWNAYTDIKYILKVQIQEL